MLTFLFVLACCEAPTWRAEQILRIGSFDGQHTAFSSIDGVAVGPDRELFVSQPSEQHIRVFDRNGAFLRRIGRHGGGPGEFRTISALTFVDGRLRVRDDTGGRVTDLALDGRVLATHRTPALRLELPYHAGPPFALDRDGNRYVIASYRVGGDEPRDVPFLVAGADGSVRTVARLRVGDSFQTVRTARWVVPVPLPVNGTTLYAFDVVNGEIVLVDRPLAESTAEQEFHILRLAPTGDTLVSRRHRYTPRAIDRATVARERSRRIDAFVEHTERSQAPISRGEVEAIWAEGFRVPRFQAGVDELVIASSGELWLRRGAFGDEVSEWIVFNRSGDAIGRLALPATTRLAHASAEHIVTIERDDLDVNHVAVYRLTRR